jgi:hypothetical protein
VLAQLFAAFLQFSPHTLNHTTCLALPGVPCRSIRPRSAAKNTDTCIDKRLFAVGIVFGYALPNIVVPELAMTALEWLPWTILTGPLYVDAEHTEVPSDQVHF